MNILIVMNDLKGGGAERVMLTIIRNLDRSRFNVTLFLIKNDITYLSEIPEDVALVFGCSKNDKLTRKLLQVIRRLKAHAKGADIIVGGAELDPTYLAVIAGISTNKPIVSWIHTEIQHFLAKMPMRHRLLLKLFYPFVSKFVAVSRGAANSLHKIMPGAEVEIIYNPLDLDRIHTNSLQITNLLSCKRPLVVAVGRLEPQKGFDILISAVALLKEKGVTPFVIVLGEGSMHAQLIKLADDLGVGTQFSFPGFNPNPYPIMRKADVFALSSRYEGLGMVILEAMALSVPVVSTDCPSGPAELLAGGSFGLLVKNENPQALADALCTLLSDSGLRQKYSDLGRSRAEAFTPSALIPCIENLLERVVVCEKSL